MALGEQEARHLWCSSKPPHPLSVPQPWDPELDQPLLAACDPQLSPQASEGEVGLGTQLPTRAVSPL